MTFSAGALVLSTAHLNGDPMTWRCSSPRPVVLRWLCLWSRWRNVYENRTIAQRRSQLPVGTAWKRASRLRPFLRCLNFGEEVLFSPYNQYRELALNSYIHYKLRCWCSLTNKVSCNYARQYTISLAIQEVIMSSIKEKRQWNVTLSH